jgi:hypothetical protein
MNKESKREHCTTSGTDYCGSYLRLTGKILTGRKIESGLGF